MSDCPNTFHIPFLLFRTFGLGVELRPSLASLANGGGVDERSEFLRTCCQTSLLGIPTLFVCTNLHVVREKAVEKVDVGVAKNREVLVLLNVGLLHTHISLEQGIHFLCTTCKGRMLPLAQFRVDITAQVTLLVRQTFFGSFDYAWQSYVS